MLNALRRIWRSFKVVIIAVVVSVGLFTAIGFAGVPWGLRYGLEQKLGPMLQRSVTVGDIAFNPYTLRLRVQDLRITEPDSDAAFVTLGRLELDAAWESLLRLLPVVESVTLTQPAIHLARVDETRFNFSDLVERFSGGPSESEPQKAPAEFSVANIRVEGGRIEFDDQVLGTRHRIEQLMIGLPVIANRPAFTDVFVQPALQAQVDGSPFGLQARSKPFSPTQESEMQIKLEGLDLVPFMGYAPATLPVRLEQGRLSAEVALVFAQSAQQPTLRLQIAAQLDELALRDRRKQPLLDIARIGVDGLTVEPFMRTLVLRELRIERPVATLARDRSGTFNLSRLTMPAAKAVASAQPAPESAPPATPFQWRVDRLLLDQGRVLFTDLSNAKPVRIAVAPLQVELQKLSQDFSQPWELAVLGTLNGKGQFRTRGTVVLEPLQVRVRVDDDRLDAVIFEPYFGRFLNASIARAYGYARGDAAFSMPNGDIRVSFRGDAGMRQLRLLDKATTDLLAGFDALELSQIRLEIAPAGTDVQVGRIALNKFQARIFLDQNGQLNLSRLIAREAGPNPSLTRPEATVVEAASAPVVAAPPAAPDTAAPPSKLNMRFGQIVLREGDVQFSDRYIQPNYNAQLSAINGKVGAFGTQSTQPAAFELQARLNGNDPLSISGSVNPLVSPPSLDLVASARDVMLTNFSTYTAHYTGYPIVAGKLSLDLHYKLDNNALSAENRIFIDQFTFGDRVEGDSVFNLPVRLAVSLLKNTKGQIDLNLPVSGSLSDPQFSIGGIVWQVIKNLIMKAVTSPFSLLASAFGGSEELGYLEFAPGSAVLTEASLAKLQTLSAALADRPEAKLDLIGRVDPALDVPALREAAVAQQVKAQKLKTLVGKGESVDPEAVTVAPEEYERFLRKAYEDAEFERERNFIGLLKTQPPEVMKKLLAEHAVVGANELQQLAQQRALGVQRWFEGRLDPNRLFVAASKLTTEGLSDKGATTRLEFALK